MATQRLSLARSCLCVSTLLAVARQVHAPVCPRSLDVRHDGHVDARAAARARRRREPAPARAFLMALVYDSGVYRSGDHTLTRSLCGSLDGWTSRARPRCSWPSQTDSSSMSSSSLPLAQTSTCATQADARRSSSLASTATQTSPVRSCRKRQTSSCSLAYVALKALPRMTTGARD